MTNPTSILVDVDASAADHPAVGQTVDLARRCGARVKIVDVLPRVPAGVRHFVTPHLEQELIAHRRERLGAIADSVQGGVPVAVELLRGRPAHALIHEVLRSGHDLLVRSHDRDTAEGPKPFGAIDMELLRQCPCPVWLVGRRPVPHSPWRVVAALNPNTDDETEQRLNVTVVEWALMLRDLAAADLTLLHAWTVFGESVLRSRLPGHDFLEYVARARRASEDAMTAFTAPLADRLRGVTVKLVEGEPEWAISNFIETNGVDLVVMGTVARTGIPGLVMGNTAERVLQRLRGSVLAIKPPGFVSPVDRT
jgi:universal stress protein E